jgi:oligopeptide transport system ATP-binding protein
MSEETALLQVQDLRVEFRTGREIVNAVNGANFSVHPGETLAILGESGSGKSVTASTIMRLLQSPPGFVTGGKVMFKGTDILKLPLNEWRKMSGKNIALVTQDALTSLNPVFKVGWQIAEMFRVHGETNNGDPMERAIELLERVGIPAPRDRANDYPHQFSGGMRQRVMIAMAVALHPQLLIADEPTTALDVTVQAQIMDLLAKIKHEEGMAVILITHDLGVVVDVADTVCVMYGGRVVEYGKVEEVMRTPAHPYTKALMDSAPQAQQKGKRLKPILGSPPDMARLPSGCTFHPRCANATDICRTQAPVPSTPVDGRMSECHHAESVYHASVNT